MKLTFTGTVRIGNSCRVAYEPDGEIDGYIWIGDRDILDEIEDATWNGPVTVAFADERFTGDLVVDRGWGYSEYTPVDSDTIKVGGHDVLDRLANLEGHEVTLWIADEPVNVLEDVRMAAGDEAAL